MHLGRLRDAQTAFQQLIVLAACSLLLHRTAAAHGRTLSPGDLTMRSVFIIGRPEPPFAASLL